ncbi:MAG: class I SAM-dependent methyltransferase [Acidobacteria bacterium]|nr:class I SAM-dependent methyltransferase [Acidobacteriota bacterium]
MKTLHTFLLLTVWLLNCQTSPQKPSTPASPTQAQTAAPKPQESIYETRTNHDPNGIGKFYMGREIAHVMGHQGADWLERDDREQTELPNEVVKQMKLKPTDVVADIGAGTGYFTFRIAPLVKQGKVLAVDIQPEMLAIIEERKKRFKAENVAGILSTETDTKLPANSVDVVLFVDAYHEFSYPREMMESIVKGLKPGGRVVQIEYRGEDPDVPIKRVHKMTVAQAKKEMAAIGLVWKETKDFLPQQHFIVFEKPR